MNGLKFARTGFVGFAPTMSCISFGGLAVGVVCIGGPRENRMLTRCGPVAKPHGSVTAPPPKRCSRAKSCYASKIQQTTNGCRRGTRGQTRRASEESAEGRIEEHGEIDERKAARRTRQHRQPQETAEARRRRREEVVRQESVEREEIRWQKSRWEEVEQPEIGQSKEELSRGAYRLPGRFAKARKIRSSSTAYLLPNESRRPVRFRPPVRA